MKLYVELIHDDGETGVFEDYFVTCEDCRFFRKNFRLYYMSPDDESPHACIHKKRHAAPMGRRLVFLRKGERS